MTYTETQLAAIRLFGRKDLTFGCIVSQGGDEYQIFNFSDRFKNARYWDNEEEEAMMIMNGGYKILGHIPHLEDLFRLAEERGWLVEIKWGLLSIHFKDRTYISFKYEGSVPIIDQPSLPEIINLFK